MFAPRTAPIPSRVDLLTTWVSRVGVALLFVTVGWSKFRDPMWVRLFQRIGLGQWFRDLTGVIQITAGVFVLVPRFAPAAIGVLACTMIGAVIAWLTVLHAPSNAPIPAVLLAILIAIGWHEYNRTRENRS